MSFQNTAVKFVETDAEETARLAQAPAGSDNALLATLPVLNRRVDEHHLYELALSAHRTCSGVTGGANHTCSGTHRIVGVPLRFHPGSSAELPLAERLHDGYWDVRVLASDHPSYPVGGYGVVASESELRRSTVVEL